MNIVLSEFRVLSGEMGLGTNRLRQSVFAESYAETGRDQSLRRPLKPKKVLTPQAPSLSLDVYAGNRVFS